ncbi:hypothetical protein TIFTF001_055761 [Ficus carica]|uniref:AAA+ ATPase At3g28540-like C-terminal domain-containing protein n=1 Tax=Ficus carica TaxID=3494 RepID=A0AA88JGT2_FICCA|nr:hypothetical protein TIFTF001_053657 [Ficus carica]GMN73984.1 hypothetical protein TIFTF001_055761 [Ficus carica]
MSPADVAENLMPKSDDEDADMCLKNLVEALEKAKEDAKKKAEEEAKLKAEEEAKLKAEEEAKLKAEEEEKTKAGKEEKVEKVGEENSAKENGKCTCNGTSANEEKENGSVAS